MVLTLDIGNSPFPVDDYSFEYPKPTKITETWRYERLRSIGEALSKSQSSTHDPETNNKMQQSLSTWLTAIENDIYHIILSVAAPEEARSSMPGCKEIADDAVRMWLDFGKERYRLVMAMPIDVHIAVPVENAIPELVIEPELRRIGNGNGEHLDKEHLVSDGGKSHHVQRR
jgi:hypothetical protein